MRVVQWSAAERRIGKSEAADFYDRPIRKPWLFHFTTQKLRLDPHEGPFSLKLVLRGHERYGFGSRQVCLKPAQLLFTAPGRTYSSEVCTRSECISLFLPQTIASRAWFGATGEHETIMSDRSTHAVDWPVPVAFAASKSVRDLMPAFLSALEHADEQMSELIALEIFAEAARNWRRTAPVTELTGPRRVATREELIGRVVRARSMIDDLGGVGCHLASLADEACLSKFHFLRVFKEAFGQTPGQYARHVRVSRGREIELSGGSIERAARGAGYSRPSALRRALRKSFPLNFEQRVRPSE